MKAFTDAAAAAVAKEIAALRRAESDMRAGLADMERRLLEKLTPSMLDAVALAVAAIPKPKDGLDGEPGEPGAPGEPGTMPIVREWADEVHYAGEVVTWDGGTYQARHDTGKAPDHDDWVCLVAPARAGQDGKDGLDGHGLAIKGTWHLGEAYRALDVVILNGASFVARCDEPGPCPGDGWQLLAAQGKRGKPGEPGRRGDPGPPVKSLTIDADGLLTLTNADGSQVTCDLYPVLVKL